MKIQPGTLKCVIVPGGADRVAEAVREHAGTDDVRRVGDALLVHTAMDASDLRDRLAKTIRDGQSLLVLEFEKWSAYGDAIDSGWLLVRGH